MKKVKSVAFNVADPMEYALYHHAGKQQYFSTYMKRLVQRDMEDGKRVNADMDTQTYNAYNEVNPLETAKESLKLLHESGIMEDGVYYKMMFDIQTKLEKEGN